MRSLQWLVYMPVWLDKKLRTQDLWNLLSPDAFQNLIRTLGKHLFPQKIGTGVLLLLHGLLNASRGWNIHLAHPLEKESHLQRYNKELFLELIICYYFYKVNNGLPAKVHCG